jgi:hypothetical protein
VTALNAVPGVMTLDSCQEDPYGMARVTFCTHENAALRDTMEYLAGIIDGQVWLEQISLRLWAGCDDDTLVAELSCPQALVPVVAAVVRIRACLMDHGIGSRSQILIDAMSMVPR